MAPRRSRTSRLRSVNAKLQMLWRKRKSEVTTTTMASNTASLNIETTKAMAGLSDKSHEKMVLRSIRKSPISEQQEESPTTTQEESHIPSTSGLLHHPCSPLPNTPIASLLLQCPLSPNPGPSKEWNMIMSKKKNVPVLKTVRADVMPQGATKIMKICDPVMENVERLLQLWIEEQTNLSPRPLDLGPSVTEGAAETLKNVAALKTSGDDVMSQGATKIMKMCDPVMQNVEQLLQLWIEDQTNVSLRPWDLCPADTEVAAETLKEVADTPLSAKQNSPKLKSPLSITKLKTRSTEQPFKCSHCPYQASRRSKLLDHIKLHTGEKPFKCSHCPYQTSKRSHLHGHIRTHTGKKPLKCSHCLYQTSWRSHLQIHIMKHISEKPFKCSHCQFQTSWKNHLRSHIMKHTGEKPFKCDYCPYQASLRESLQIHVIIRHTNEKPFKCDHCLYRASQKYVLQVHLRTHTGVCDLKN